MNYENLTEVDIFEKGLNDPDFNYYKGLDALLEKDETGICTYRAGRDWKTFDYKKGLDGLFEKDRTGYWVYWSGLDWKTFDYKKGLKHLLKIKSEYLQRALNHWEVSGIKLSNEEVLEFINLI